MPRVRLLIGMNIADEHRNAGDEVDVAADVATYLTEYGRAELVRSTAPEKAVRAPREKTSRK